MNGWTDYLRLLYFRTYKYDVPLFAMEEGANKDYPLLHLWRRG
jgi:hypothetical protein